MVEGAYPSMFKPSRGPKEGRTHPGLLFAGTGNGKAKFTPRQASIALVVGAILLFGWFYSSSSSNTTPSTAFKPGSGRLGDALRGDVKGSYPGADANIPGVHAEIPSFAKSGSSRFSEDSQTGYGAPSRPNGGSNKPMYGMPLSGNEGGKPLKPSLEDVYPKAHPPPTVEQIRKGQAEVGSDSGNGSPSKFDGGIKGVPYTSAPAREHWSDRPNFERALQRVVDMLPDEVHMRELVRPVESTGKERMREMGLRTRAYKKYFDAWEALHLVTDEDGVTYIRDDVIQYYMSQGSTSSAKIDDEDGVALPATTAQTIRAYEGYRAFINKFAELLFPWTSPYFADHMTLHAHFKKGGRGIVLTAGDDQAPYLLTTIYSFRKLGCMLPIEVMYLGDQDLGEDYRAELEALPGVVTRDISQMTDDQGWRLAGWAAKPFAILYSSFREVIFIDADSLFFKNPEILFEDPGYKETGALFFKDRKIMPENKKRWLQQVLPKPISKLAKQSRFWTGESGHMQESGVVVIDKWQHFVSMLLITRFNGPDRDGNKEKGRVGVYDLVYGDKETFWLGFLLAGDERYHFHTGDAGIMGELEPDQPEPDEKAKKEHKKRDGSSEGSESASDSSDEHREAKRDQPTDEKSEDTHSNEIHIDLTPRPQTWTICAPQLLHLDVHGKPLWFNGWLLHNKFVDRSKKHFARFENYLIEPRDVRDPGAWQLAEANQCCLTTDADKKFEFSEEERAILDMIMKRAEVMGMGDQS